MKIAIIGAGFFGSACAMILSKKHKIHLFEKQKNILCGASMANQQRFHLGYHYPRSKKTVNEIKNNFIEFKNFFGTNAFGTTKNYYGISKEKSKINFKNYLKFLKQNNLEFKKIKIKDFSDKIEGQIISKEFNLNYFFVKKKIEQELKKNNIRLFCNTKFSKRLLKNYDKIIIATYDQNNKILDDLGITVKNKKYELVEKIIVELPLKYRNNSYIVLDGNFVCLDPFVGTKYHLLSDVKYSKLEVVKDKFGKFTHPNIKYLNQGVVKKKDISQFKNFISHGSQYLPILKEAKYYGSFYVVRALKTQKEKTDERLNEINYINNKIITIFSGKWNTCIGVAKKIESMILK